MSQSYVLKKKGKPVSRVLYSPKRISIIYLEHLSPNVSSNPPPEHQPSQPTYAGVLDLATHKAHSHQCHHQCW